MYRIIQAIIAILALSFFFGCGSSRIATGGGGSTPTEAYKNLFAAVKSKDTESIKRQMTKKTLEMGLMQSERNKKPIEQVYENGFTATTFADTLPNVRDERVSGDMANVEVWNSKDSRWEDLPFMKEDGSWKLAIGDLFAGSFVSPGPGRDIKERQAANAVTNNNIIVSNSSSKPPTITNAGPMGPISNKNQK